MSLINKNVFRFWVWGVGMVLSLSGCGVVPTSGPSYSQATALGNLKDAENLPVVEVIDITDSVLGHLYHSAESYSFAEFSADSKGYNDLVDAGDVLDIAIWEAPPALLFGGALTSLGSGNAQLTKLPEQMVANNGKITVPFLGALYVKGKTPEAIQNDIVNRLRKMANQPQVMVRLVKNNSANVVVVRAGSSIRMPLTAQGERVLDAVAAIGGTADDIRDVSVQLTRGGVVKTIAFETLTTKPAENVLLRTGDVVALHSKPLSFTALGAVGKVQQFRFSAKGMNLGEALGQMGGLLDRRANPKGVFIFRYQPLSKLSQPEQGKWLAKGYTMDANVPTVYRIDLLDAKSLFWMQKFAMQDKDIVYVANAPLVELQKFLQFVFSPVVSGASSINNIAN